MKRSVGSLIVRENRIVSTGYLGTPKAMANCYENGCDRCNSKEEMNFMRCLCIHSEEAALLEAGKKKSFGATCYSTCYPCVMCAQLLIAHGIKRIVYDELDMPESEISLIDSFYKKANIVTKRVSLLNSLSTYNYNF